MKIAYLSFEFPDGTSGVSRKTKGRVIINFLDKHIALQVSLNIRDICRLFYIV